MSFKGEEINLRHEDAPKWSVCYASARKHFPVANSGFKKEEVVCLLNCVKTGLYPVDFEDGLPDKYQERILRGVTYLYSRGFEAKKQPKGGAIHIPEKSKSWFDCPFFIIMDGGEIELVHYSQTHHYEPPDSARMISILEECFSHFILREVRKFRLTVLKTIWAKGFVHTTTLSFADYQQKLAQLKNAEKEIKEGNEKRKAGGHCGLCNFKNNCTAYAEYVSINNMHSYIRGGEMFDDTGKPVVEMSNQELADVLDLESRVLARFKEVREEAEKRDTVAPGSIPSYAKQSSRKRQSWSLPQAEMIELFKKKRWFKSSEFEKVKVASPAEILKLCSDKRKEQLKAYIVEEPCAAKLKRVSALKEDEEDLFSGFPYPEAPKKTNDFDFLDK